MKAIITEKSPLNWSTLTRHYTFDLLTDDVMLTGWHNGGLTTKQWDLTGTSTVIGTALGTGAWQIKKIDKTVADNVTITHAAAGAFTATWNNRGSETYS